MESSPCNSISGLNKPIHVLIHFHQRYETTVFITAVPDIHHGWRSNLWVKYSLTCNRKVLPFMNIICANATVSKAFSLSIMTIANLVSRSCFPLLLMFHKKTINFSLSKKTQDWKIELQFYTERRMYVIARTPFYFLLHLKLIYSCQTPLKHSGINKLPFLERKSCSNNKQIIIKIIIGTNVKQNNHCKCVGVLA